MKVVCDRGLNEKVFILVGVGPLSSVRAAEWMRSNIPGVHIPDDVIERLAGAADARREGQRICIDMIQQIRAIEGISGVHVMAYRHEASAAQIIDESGVLEGRTPWYPGRPSAGPARTSIRTP
jgi:methylenetetrahydrofolate reductase (NADPH)